MDAVRFRRGTPGAALARRLALLGSTPANERVRLVLIVQTVGLGVLLVVGGSVSGSVHWQTDAQVPTSVPLAAIILLGTLVLSRIGRSIAGPRGATVAWGTLLWLAPLLFARARFEAWITCVVPFQRFHGCRRYVWPDEGLCWALRDPVRNALHHFGADDMHLLGIVALLAASSVLSLGPAPVGSRAAVDRALRVLARGLSVIVAIAAAITTLGATRRPDRADYIASLPVVATIPAFDASHARVSPVLDDESLRRRGRTRGCPPIVDRQLDSFVDGFVVRRTCEADEDWCGIQWARGTTPPDAASPAWSTCEAPMDPGLGSM